jgi:sulfite exporter TauE/SafE
MDLGAMFVLGLVGSGHCVGMCGPLVLAIPTATGKVVPHLLYHAGRVTTYALIGGAFGALGQGMAHLSGADQAGPVAVQKIQLGLNLMVALFLLAFGLMRLGLLAEPRWLTGAGVHKLPILGRVLRNAAQGQSQSAILVLGLLMGLLPCGLSYAAFARALPAGGFFSGAALVLAFGLGTAPALLILGTVASRFARRYRRVSDVLSSVLLIAMAVRLGLKALL